MNGDHRDFDIEGADFSGTQRLDKWLWFARVVKSRTLASELVKDGKVRINRTKVDKPSQPVKPGDVLTVAVGPRVRILKVRRLGQRRGPAPEARELYSDRSTPSPPPDAAFASPGERQTGSGRPTKRDRRQIERLKQGSE